MLKVSYDSMLECENHRPTKSLLTIKCLQKPEKWYTLANTEVFKLKTSRM